MRSSWVTSCCWIMPGPHTFTPGNEKRGVGEHPHRGFETVTIVYSGEVEHRDSTDRGGVIGPGDVQWMTTRRRHFA
ncbi:pirin family protein [Salmonella enterica subsp. enterica]|nr:pirin family protein [Salmonella enterica subsp. enterica]